MLWMPIALCVLSLALPARSAQAQISQLFDSSVPSKLVGEVIANDGQGNLEVKYEATRGVGSTGERTVRIDMTEASFFQYPVTVYATTTSCVRSNNSPYLVRFEDVKDLLVDPTDEIFGWLPRRFDPNLGDFFAAHVVTWQRFSPSESFQLTLMGTDRTTRATFTARAVITAQGTCEVLSPTITFINNVEVIPIGFPTDRLQEDGDIEPRFIAPYRVDNPILDTDGDGVPNDVDVCPSSPPNILVDTDGCTEIEVCSLDLLDRQSQLDACEAELATVDRFTDSDGDGEEDSTDLCPGTPPLAEVDSDGCSLDQFCTSIDATTNLGTLDCKRADFQNDEPSMSGSQRDCVVDKGAAGRGDDRCVPVGQ